MRLESSVLLLPTLRLRDLLRQTVEAVRLCHRCGHKEEIDGAELMGRLGPHAFLKHAINEMACGRCAHTGHASWKSSAPISRYGGRVGDLMAVRGQLAATCGACRRRWEVDVVDAMRRLGPDVRIAELRDALPCPFCRRRGWAVVKPGGRVDAAYPDDHPGTMCGRFAIHSPTDQIATRFGVVGQLPEFGPRYNAAPLQMLPVIRTHPETRERTFSLLRWGLVPVWSKDSSGAARMINARAESVPEKPSFRTAFKKRRCLVPLDNFYEWKIEGKTKQPYAIGTTSNEKPDAFAGLWEGWRDPSTNEWLHTFTIITTTANDVTAAVHDRMPVILPPAAWAAWLGEEEASADELVALMRPYPADQTRLWPVHREVGNVRNDRADLIEPINPA
jgi:putative SOS response-associated peptidase YedK